MGPHLSPSLLRMIRPSPSDTSDKSSSDRHFVTWTDQEDEVLRNAVGTYGIEKWSVIAAQFHNKTSRQCRRRWNTYLSVDFKKGGWSPEEDKLLLEAQRKFGNRWTEIAKVVPGRTDNAVKNRFSALGKKEAKKLGISNQSDVEAGKFASCRRVLEPISNIINKRSRLSDGCNELKNLQKQSHLQNKKTIPIWKSEQSMADRAHPVHSRKPRKSFTHCDLKPFQLSETDQREANNYCLGKKSIMNEDKTNILDLPQEIITPPRLPPSLSQNITLSNSVIGPNNAMKLWGCTNDVWKPFNWARTEVSTNLQTHNYDIEHPKHGEVVNTCFEGKDLHYSPYGSQITSIFRIDEEIAHHHEQHEVGIGTPVILRERSWKIRHEQEGLECSSSSNIGSHQGDDSTSAQNDCFTSVQVNQAIMATDDEVEGVYSNTNGQGFDCKDSNASPTLISSAFCDVSASLDFTWYSGCMIDDIPSPQFSDSEKLFLLSAFD